MRYVSVRALKPGMILAKTLLDEECNVWLGEGVILKENFISKIKSLGYHGIYIKDAYSVDIDTKAIISEDIRTRAINVVRDSFVIHNYEEEELNSTLKKEIEKITRTITEIIDGILDSDSVMVNLVDLRNYNNYTFCHSVNVTVLSLIVGIAYGLESDDLYTLGFGAILHDIGKLFIPSEIINKPTKLNEQEKFIVRQHPIKGSEYIRKQFHLEEKVCESIVQHHEHYNGEGYPKNLRGEEISIYARIISVCDVFDALTSDRIYRKAAEPFEIMEYIMANGGTHFDANIVQIFVKKVAAYPVGTSVKLSNNLIGIVHTNYEQYSMRPRVKIIKDSLDNYIEPYLLDLANDPNLRNITIVDTVNNF